jgi:DNA-directed RNA polymerase III subunit RPC5
MIGLLQEKEHFKRSELVEAAKVAGIPTISDTLYNKVVKELCASKGGSWWLKQGADG